MGTMPNQRISKFDPMSLVRNVTCTGRFDSTRLPRRIPSTTKVFPLSQSLDDVVRAIVIEVDADDGVRALRHDDEPRVVEHRGEALRPPGAS